MQTPSQALNCTCQCKANSFDVTDEILGRFICHCEVCQKFTGKGYSDVTVILAKDVSEKSLKATKFERMKLPPNIRRGTCIQCNKPSIEYGIFNSLAFIPSSNYAQPEALPEPSLHMFYHRRLENIDDQVPKYEGFLKSQLAVTGLIVKGLIRKLKR